MNPNYVLQILGFSLPAVVIAITQYYLLNRMLQHQVQLQALKNNETSKAITTPLRLQAYERLALLMERIDVFVLVQKIRTPNMNAAELQLIATNQIRQEFEHNLSQQIYVSAELWSAVRSTKEEMIMTINKIGSSMPPQAAAKEFHRNLLEYLNEYNGVLPTHKTLELIKAEAKKMY